MNGVLGMVEALSATALSEPQARMVRVIREAGDALMNILNDILDFSKIEANQMTLEHVPFRVGELGAKIESLHALKAREKNLDFNILYGGDPETRRLGDPHRILQILHNLITNAIKFTSTGEVRVELCCCAEHCSAEEFLITVSDTGIGMTADQCVHVFRQFAQADDSTTRQYGGTGLGLAIVKGLVEAMEGELTMDSEPGVGTTIRVRLPLPVVDQQRVTEEKAPAAEGPFDFDATAWRILAAEDNAMNRMVLQALLAPMGVDIVFAENGQQAVDIVKQEDFDIILMDIQMPVMDGVAAMKEIRTLQDQGTVPLICIIALTANALDAQVKTYMEAGFDAHVAKPIHAASLFAVIDKAVSIRQTGMAMANLRA